MLASKTAHFGYLESLDLKYRHGGVRSLAERARLETLLTAHDKCVAEFASQIKALGAIDQRARDLLLGLMTEAGDTGKNARQ